MEPISHDKLILNMCLMSLHKHRHPYCPNCGYFRMKETMHEVFINRCGITYYKCPNCEYESNSEVL